MATLTLPGVLLTGDHASRPAATAVGTGTLYACSTHGLIYQSNGATWSTWATLGTAGALVDQGTFTYVDGTVAAAPGTPAAGKLRIYAKTGKVLAVKDDAGAETVLGSGIADGGVVSTYIDYTDQGSDPASPSAGRHRFYAKAGGLYVKDSGGAVVGALGAGGGGSATPEVNAAGRIYAYSSFR